MDIGRQELPHCSRDLFDVGLQREVPGIQELHARIWIVPPVSQRVEGIFVAALLWNIGKPESRKIGRYNPVPVRKTWNQLPILKRRCGKAVQQQHHRRIRRAGFP
jgi:hypothetical protein